MELKSLIWLAASVLLAAPLSAQQAAGAAKTILPSGDALPAAAPDSPSNAPVCPRFENKERPVDTTIQARVTELLDSSHLKPGDEVFAKVLYGIAYPGCALNREAILYGHVTAAASSKKPSASELGLVFDHADCEGSQKQDLRMRLVGLVAPPDHTTMEHDVLPSRVHGSVQPLPPTSHAGIDDNLDPATYPKTVYPGLVVRLPKVKLNPEGAPGCSAKISSTAHDLRVAPGAELIFTVERLMQAKP